MSFKNESLDVSFSKIKEIGFVKIGDLCTMGLRVKNVSTVTKDHINEETEHSVSCFICKQEHQLLI